MLGPGRGTWIYQGRVGSETIKELLEENGEIFRTLGLAMISWM